MRLHGIANKPMKREDMQPVDAVEIVATGLSGGYKALLATAEKSRRQVTVISLEQWQEAVSELGGELPWHLRRAELCVTGYRFGPEDVGRNIAIGDTVLLEITGETEPCYRMDAISPGLKRTLMKQWRGGVTCRVIDTGTVRVGDGVAFARRLL